MSYIHTHIYTYVSTHVYCICTHIHVCMFVYKIISSGYVKLLFNWRRREDKNLY